LEPELMDVIATPAERHQLGSHQDGQEFGARLLFVAKEAIYKAVHPLDGVFLDHHDVEVDLTGRKAVVLRTGRTVPLRLALANHIVALAYIERAG
jgi:4'-phosphopantetheinyl transferase EntD